MSAPGFGCPGGERSSPSPCGAADGPAHRRMVEEGQSRNAESAKSSMRASRPQGVVALRQDDFSVTTPEYVVEPDATTRGWIAGRRHATDVRSGSTQAPAPGALRLSISDACVPSSEPIAMTTRPDTTEVATWLARGAS